MFQLAVLSVSLVGMARASATVAVESLADLETIILRVGDSLSVPDLAAGESLAYDTNAVVSLNGKVFSVREPGACRIRRFGPDPETGDTVETESGVLVAAPREEDVRGGLFVRRTGTGDFSWCNAASWEKISGPDGHDWPNGADDIALVYLPLTRNMSASLGGQDITLGYLGAGSTLNAYTLNFRTGALTFRTSDGSESWIRFSGRTGGNGALSFPSLPVTLDNDLVLDGMGQDFMNCSFGGTLAIGEHVLRTARVLRYGSAPFPSGQIHFGGDVTGDGTIRLEANAPAGLGSFPARKSFRGTWTAAGCPHDGNYGGSALFLGNAYLGNAAELKVSGAWHADKSKRRGASVRTGWSNSYQFTAPTNFWRGGVLPPKVTIDGGQLLLVTQGPFDSAAKTAFEETGIRDDWLETGELRLAAGPMGELRSEISIWHNGLYPNTHAVVTNLVAEPGATAGFALSTAATPGANPTITNEFFIVEPPAAAWTAPEDGYAILPFLCPNCEVQGWFVPVRLADTGRVVLTNGVSTDESTGNIRLIDPGWNASGGHYVAKIANGSEWQALLLAKERTCWFDEPESVVKVLSGFVGMRSFTFGQLDHTNSASSTLDFGDRTGYVYVGFQDETGVFGCRLAGTAGFVKSAPGTLELHQPLDGLTGGVVVNAGRLSLVGDATFGTNDVSVAAGARLRLSGGRPFPARDSRLDLETREWISVHARVELENAAPVSIHRLRVNGECLPRGTYGSSESAAEFANDDLFSGPGVLRVLSDETTLPTSLLLL